MGKHLRKLFSTKEVKEILKRYLGREIGVEHALALFKIKRRQFFKLLKAYREDPESFSLEYRRNRPTNQIDSKTEKKILVELEKEKELITDQRNPIRFYNYSYVQNVLEEKHGVDVSLSTIIRRAKKGGFMKRRNPEKTMTGKS